MCNKDIGRPNLKGNKKHRSLEHLLVMMKKEQAKNAGDEIRKAYEVNFTKGDRDTCLALQDKLKKSLNAVDDILKEMQVSNLILKQKYDER